MAILWLTEALPIPVTSLLPIFMFPMLQVAGAREISASYITVSIWKPPYTRGKPKANEVPLLSIFISSCLPLISLFLAFLHNYIIR